MLELIHNKHSERNNKKRNLTTNKVLNLVRQLSIECSIDLEPKLRSSRLRASPALSTLKVILTKTRAIVLQEDVDLNTIVHCAFILLHHYMAKESVLQLFKSKKLKKSEDFCCALIRLLCPEKSVNVTMITLKYLDEEKLWKIKFFASQTLAILIQCGTQIGLILHAIVKRIQIELKSSIDNTKTIFQVFMELLDLTNWKDLQASELAEIIRLFHSSVAINGPLSPFKICLANCLMKLFKLMNFSELLQSITQLVPLCLDTGLNAVSQVQFANVLLHAIDCLEWGDHNSHLISLLIEYLLDIMSTCEMRRTVLACKILSRLFDDAKNTRLFLKPKIFHFNTPYDIQSHPLDSQKFQLYIKFREKFDTAIFLSTKRFGFNLANMGAVFGLLCQIVVKSSKSTQAIFLICVLMQIQRHAINTNIQPKVANLMHALVIAVLSLFSWIHRGKALHKYVSGIEEKRNFKAPHLLPPLRVGMVMNLSL